MAQLNITNEYDGFNLPYSPEAEQSVLGAILLDSSCLDTIVNIIRLPEYFHLENHKLIYSAIYDLYTKSKAVDFITVNEYLKAQSGGDSGSMKNYLLQLVEYQLKTANVEAYANIIREKYEVRSLIMAARSIIDDATTGEYDVNDLIDSAEQRIYNIRSGKNVEGLRHIKEVIVETSNRLNVLNSEDNINMKPTSTGISMLDKKITGLNRSDLILLAARPGMGKTSFALNIARSVAVQSKKVVAFFSLEMSNEQLVSRLLSTEALIESTKLKTGKLNGDEWVRLIEACDILSSTKMYIDDTPNVTVPTMKAKLRRLGENVDLVVIDYLQLMNSARRIDNRVQEIADITRSLKIMAKELDVPVITLSQLSRAVEQRADHRPQLSDLRDSGSIEQDADIVMFLYREAYGKNTQTDEDIDQNSSVCIVSKNRHGETGDVKMHWQGEFTRFTSVENLHEE